MIHVRTGAAALFATLVLAGGARAQSDSVTIKLTLGEAVERALRNSLEIVRASGSVSTSECLESLVGRQL